MCKHIPNVQVSFRAPCCNRWFDCSECHFELSDHRQQPQAEMAFVCKQCRNPFRKDLTAFDEEDESCPHCGNRLVQPVGDVSNSRAVTPAVNNTASRNI
ncbi:Zinc finger protein [Phytophthora palmivora]|uniref:Zinc finger protein n=1 Tax=Phytophthora palmivora TaxID=4796 RepID=A0A2P4XM29_9STRA|nr:Zinc finger protein [Phytophthora palmivora]